MSFVQELCILLLLDVYCEVSGSPCEAMVGVTNYHDGFCYRMFLDNPQNHTNAQTICQSLGAELAMPMTYERAGFLIVWVNEMASQLPKTDKQTTGYFLGGSKVAGQFKWSNGEVVELNDLWNSGQPDNFEGKESCLELRKDYAGRQNDVPCADPNDFICQKYIGDPCEELMVGSEYFYGQCFLVHNEKEVYAMTKARCEESRAFLAEPRTLPLYNFILKLIYISRLDTSLKDFYLLGGSDKTKEGVFTWLTTGLPVTLNAWPPDQPSNNSQLFGESQLMISYETKKLYPVNATTTKFHFVCQKEAAKYTYLAVLARGHHQYAQLYISSTLATSFVFCTVTQAFPNSFTNDTQEEIVDIALSLQPTFALQLQPQTELAGEGLEKRYIMISSNYPVTAVLVHHDVTSFSGTLILPFALLMQSYFVYTSASALNQSKLMITAVNDDTEVTLKLSQMTSQDALLSLGRVSFLRPMTTWVSLMKYQTFLIASTDAILGFIFTSKPVAVFVRTPVPAVRGTYAPAEITNMLLPADLMMSEYVTFPTWPLSSQENDTFLLLALYNNTYINIYGPVNQTVLIESSNHIREIHLPAQAFYYLQSDLSFQAIKTVNQTRGACVTTLVPTSLWQSKYQALISISESLVTAVIYVICENTSSIAVESKLIGSNLTKKCYNILGTPLSSCYFEIPLRVPSTSERISLSSEGISLSSASKKFAAYIVLYNNDRSISTCYPLGLDTLNISQIQPFDGIAYISRKEDPCSRETEDYAPTMETTFNSVFFSTVENASSVSETSTSHVTPNIEDLQLAIQKELHIDRVNTAAYRRTKISADDHRPSSQAFGLVGISLLVFSFGLFVINDITSFIGYMSMMQNHRGH